MNDPVLSESEVQNRMARLEAADYPADLTIQIAEDFVRYARGAAAEDGVRTLVDLIPDQHLGPLVKRYVRRVSTDPHDPCSPVRKRLLAQDLTARGFEVHEERSGPLRG